MKAEKCEICGGILEALQYQGDNSEFKLEMVREDKTMIIVHVYVCTKCRNTKLRFVNRE